ncbi:MAG TPA: right-handed parallel beta-helix repeat-containing protein [Fibrobacteria bacterium]|nr:right-handed parallel beta-helix repeat-containing protein [Fibrobacteria bacterium]
MAILWETGGVRSRRTERSSMRLGHGLRFPLLLVLGSWAATYHVGPGQALANIADAPLSTLAPGDSVLIHARAEPYREKFVLSVEGTAERPVVVRGVPDPSDGSLPRIVGTNAVNAKGQNFWSEGRGLIKIGGANTPSTPAAHIRIENLDLSGAKQGGTFTDRNGSQAQWPDNAAAVFVESGTDIHIRGCRVHGNGNGLFSASASKDVVIESNTIWDNGNAGSIYEHNSYTESDGIVFQWNDYGALCEGCDGNNLKDRSAGTVIRYNRIDGGNRQLDLVDSDHDEILARPTYRRTYVLGNLLIEREGSGNRQMVHYGGDNGDNSTYRNGILRFHHNTLWSDRTDRNTWVRLSSPRDTIDARNNVVFTKAPGSSLELMAGEGVMLLSGNWLPVGWNTSFEPKGKLVDANTNRTGTDPGWVDLATEDFRPAAGSPLSTGSVAIPQEDGAPSIDFWLDRSRPLSWVPRASREVVGAFGTGSVAVLPRRGGQRVSDAPRILPPQGRVVLPSSRGWVEPSGRAVPGPVGASH